VQSSGDDATVVWRVTLKQDFSTAGGVGVVLKAGTTLDLSAVLRRAEGKWLIVRF
jgi:hypothetical protein